AALLLETARDHERASEMFHVAAENALRGGANREAASLARRGLQLLPRLPDSPVRTARELALTMALAVGLRATLGFADPEVEQGYRRALAVCQQLGGSARLFPALYGLALYYLMRGDLPTSDRVVTQLEEIAEREQDSVLLAQANLHRGVALLHAG